MTDTLTVWADRFWEDLQPTPGRLNSSLRIVLSTVLALVLIMALRMPQAALGLYFIFLIGRDSPSISVRSGFFSLLALIASVTTVLAVVSLTDNDPAVRLLSVSIVSFLAGMLMLSTTVTVLASTWGFIYCLLITFWETQASPDFIVKQSLYVVGTVAIGIGCAVAVEYVFGNKHPAEELQKQRLMRYEALERMFRLYAQGAPKEQIGPAVIAVSRLAAAGQNGMMHLYNIIVDRAIDPGSLPIGTRVRITMLAQLMDVAAAFGMQNPAIEDEEIRRRCEHIATLTEDLTRGIMPADELRFREPQAGTGLLDRVDQNLHAILTMPLEPVEKDKELAALPSSKVSIFIPGAFWRKETVTFALKISLCATICYIIVRAVAWPGISTAVITVLISGLSTSGAIKQKLIFRLAGSAIGGLILGLGATIFLFPHMDSITALVLLVGGVAMLAAWWAAGRQFGYVGLQIAFSFYLVAFEGFSASTELAPARDRFIGILLALVVMAFVFDLLWPVRTVTAMRAALASMLQSEAKFLRLSTTGARSDELLKQANTLRDQIGKTMASIRTLNDTVEYEFGVDIAQHKRSGEAILGAALTSVAFFWNQFAVLHRSEDHDFVAQPQLIAMRARMAEGLEKMSISVAQKKNFEEEFPSDVLDPDILGSSRYGEYARNSIGRYEELERIVETLRVLI
ncbi:FUSC family protein [Edaphobacter flagellatus]|uniref:FUSC family protein n=1 Tax=Edaphobacter flagellatus TaxID=1933044 RepID=UPI0021B3CA59|nr:FUSC family protein [Edaphobacter flagellatus]